MRRVLSFVITMSVAAAPAFADVKITASGSGKGLGMGAEMRTVTLIKGNKMRTEVTVKNDTFVTITDLDAQKLIVVNLKKKEAEVYDLGRMAADVNKSVGSATPKVVFKPNGQKKDVLGRSCAGYDMEISIAMAEGKEGPNDMRIVMAGPVWIGKDAPGTRDFLGYYKAAIEKGFIMNNAQQAKAQPAQVKAYEEMYRSMIATGGMPFAQEMTMKMEGGGPMAGLMNRVSGMSMNTTVTEVSVEGLPDELFAVPAGFKSKTK